MNIKNRRITRAVAMFMVLLTLFNIFIVDVFAGDTVFIECLIDETTKKYMTTPVSDTNKDKNKLEYKGTQVNKYVFKLCGIEESGNADNNICYDSNDSPVKTNTENDYKEDDLAKRTGYSESLENFWINTELYTTSDQGQIVLEDTADATNTYNGDDKLKSTFFFKKGKDFSELLPLSWPSSPSEKTVTSDELNYAQEVGSILTNSLNQLINLAVNGEEIKDIRELMAISVALRPKDGEAVFNKYKFYYKSDVSGQDGKNPKEVIDSLKGQAFDINQLPNYDTKGNLLVYIVPNKANVKMEEASYAVYAMPKGYRKTNGGPASKQIKFTDADNGGKGYKDMEKDAGWVNIFMLSQYANGMYKAKGTTVGSKNEADDGNIVMNWIAAAIQGLIRVLLAALGLKPVDELVYNRGFRSTNLYNFGTMSDNWWKVVLQYHLIFQAFAWFIIVCGFLKTCISLNMSRMNPQARENGYESITRFLVVGFGLVLVIPLCQFLMEMNNSIVQIFATQVGDQTIDQGPNLPGLAGIVFALAYAGIRIYINFVYIMRSITIALLIVSAPFFIAVGAWSKSGYNNSLTSQWSKELIANIFMQSIHAFTLAFLVNLMGYGSGLEAFVISYSIIPITEMFRGLVFQGAGSSTVQLGQQAGEGAKNMVKGYATSLGGAAAGGVAKLMGGGGSKGTGEGEGSGEGNGSGNGGKKGEQSSGFGALNNAISQKMSKIKDNMESGSLKNGGEMSTAGKIGRGVGVAALGAMKGMGHATGNLLKTVDAMTSAQLSGNTKYYSDVGQSAAHMTAAPIAAGYGGIKDMVQRAGNKAHSEQNKNLQLDEEGNAAAYDNDYAESLGDFANKGADGKTPAPPQSPKTGISEGSKEASYINQHASNARKAGAGASTQDRIALAMQTAADKSMKKGFDSKMAEDHGFGNAAQAKDYLANQGISFKSGGKSRSDGTASDYTYTYGHKSPSTMTGSAKLDDGSSYVTHGIPKGSGGRWSEGANNSVDLNFSTAQFEALAKRNSNAGDMLKEMEATGGNEGMFANGVKWSRGAEGYSFNYGQEYRSINGVQKMEITNNGKGVNAFMGVGNRDFTNANLLSTGSGTMAMNGTTPLRPGFNSDLEEQRNRLAQEQEKQ